MSDSLDTIHLHPFFLSLNIVLLTLCPLQVFAVPVQKKDVVILGSDGIWDNLFEEQVIEIVNSVRRAGGEPGVCPLSHQKAPV